MICVNTRCNPCGRSPNYTNIISSGLNCVNTRCNPCGRSPNYTNIVSSGLNCVNTRCHPCGRSPNYTNIISSGLICVNTRCNPCGRSRNYTNIACNGLICVNTRSHSCGRSPNYTNIVCNGRICVNIRKQDLDIILQIEKLAATLNIFPASTYYSNLKLFLLNSISPSSLILHNSFDRALRSRFRKSASCWRLKGIVKSELLLIIACCEK